MRKCFTLTLIYLFLQCGHFAASAQIIDSIRIDTTQTKIAENAAEVDEEFNVFLMTFALAGVAVMLAMAVITIAAALLVLLCIAALIGAGIFSASVGIGLYRKSVAAGIKTAVYLVSGIVGAIGGAGLGWSIRTLFDLPLGNSAAILSGGIAGATGGLMGRVALVWLVRQLFQRFAMKQDALVPVNSDQRSLRK